LWYFVHFHPLKCRDIQAFMSSLQNELAQLGNFSNRDAPISSLPNEILALIFLHGQRMYIATKHPFPPANFESDIDSIETGSEPRSSPGFEVTISHVTHHWRNVTINTPFLWTNINVSSQSSLQKLGVYLDRSGTCLLNLSVQVHENTTEQLELLIRNVGRWRMFSANSNSEGRKDVTPALLRDLAAPHLMHLSMRLDALEYLELMPNNVGDRFPQIFTSGAPVLSFVRLGGHAMSFFRPPLTTLTTLHLDHTTRLPVSYGQFCEIITASPTLANLSIYGDIIGMEPWPSTANSIEMSALKSLRICGIGGHVYSAILLNILAPGLESLVLKDVMHHDLDQLWAFPQRPKFPALRSLTFRDFGCTETMYQNFFHEFPAITHFTSSNSSWYAPRVLKLMGRIVTTIGGGTGETGGDRPILIPASVPWPRLHTVTLVFDFNDEVEASLIDMVTARIRLGCPITKLRLAAVGKYNKLRAVPLVQHLRGHVQVERFSGIDPWPDILHYVDEDDVMF
jgi:hypothetical protein